MTGVQEGPACPTYTEESLLQDHVPLRQVHVQIVVSHVGKVGDVVGQGVVLPHLSVIQEVSQRLVGNELVREGLDANQLSQASTVQTGLRAHEKRDGVQHVGTDELQQGRNWENSTICLGDGYVLLHRQTADLEYIDLRP